MALIREDLSPTPRLTGASQCRLLTPTHVQPRRSLCISSCAWSLSAHLAIFLPDGSLHVGYLFSATSRNNLIFVCILLPACYPTRSISVPFRPTVLLSPPVARGDDRQPAAARHAARGVHALLPLRLPRAAAPAVPARVLSVRLLSTLRFLLVGCGCGCGRRRQSMDDQPHRSTRSPVALTVRSRSCGPAAATACTGPRCALSRQLRPRSSRPNAIPYYVLTPHSAAGLPAETDPALLPTLLPRARAQEVLRLLAAPRGRVRPAAGLAPAAAARGLRALRGAQVLDGGAARTAERAVQLGRAARGRLGRVAARLFGCWCRR